MKKSSHSKNSHEPQSSSLNQKLHKSSESSGSSLLSNEGIRLPSKQGHRNVAQNDTPHSSTPVQSTPMLGEIRRGQPTLELHGGGFDDKKGQGSFGAGGYMAKHGSSLLAKAPQSRDGLHDHEEDLRHRNQKDSHEEDASERRRKHQGLNSTLLELPSPQGNYGYIGQIPPPSRGEGQRSKPHFVKDPKRQSMEAPMMKMEVSGAVLFACPVADLALQVLMDQKSPRQQMPQGGYGMVSKKMAASKGYGKHGMQSLAPLSGYDTLHGKSSHGSRLKQDLSLSSGSAYKSIAGYNSMQIPEEDRHLLNSMPLDPQHR
eukprot:762476-Hanusia_phi.AAC.7